jgi:hypothetical protein
MIFLFRSTILAILTDDMLVILQKLIQLYIDSKVCAHKTPPIVTDVPVPSKESDRSCICVLVVIYLCVNGHVFVC